MNSVWKPMRPRVGMRYRGGYGFAVRHHVAQFAFALAHALHHRPLVLFVQIQDDEFVGFVRFAIDFFVDDFGARDAQFVAFAPHGFDEDREVQFAAAAVFEFVRVVHFFDAQRDGCG